MGVLEAAFFVWRAERCDGTVISRDDPRKAAGREGPRGPSAARNPQVSPVRSNSGTIVLQLLRDAFGACQSRQLITRGRWRHRHPTNPITTRLLNSSPLTTKLFLEMHSCRQSSVYRNLLSINIFVFRYSSTIFLNYHAICPLPDEDCCRTHYWLTVNLHFFFGMTLGICPRSKDRCFSILVRLGRFLNVSNVINAKYSTYS